MARSRDRIIALVIVVIFFITSFSVSFLVIWQLYKDNKEAKTVNQDTSTPANDAQKTGEKLEGTKLAGFTPVDVVAEMQITDLQPGNGAEAKAGDTVTVDYTGAVAATGTIFQSSLDTGQPVSFPLGNVIKGWQEGIPGMKAGGKRRLVIPAEKAYGANPPQGSNIPADAALVFDVTLHSVGQ
ncbi:MAG TPA: FKBP-type peptidyl-prolyl cis-trans isomerase [Candidatus Saccharimonadales bacterium]|nr:FKBP-type peptidyl-prolyl cis-trans isomerase [Candidatus Saccharimonadales bacterium]